ncbi:MAG: ADP-ribosylglycohydrolase family protein [Spirochaetales bacterium]|nr:ADP-ribosylglycohydrolase family protein [Spirochaetales bacterium]
MSLQDKVYGGIIGSAIGDAMGGPVEGLSCQEIEAGYGRLCELLPYEKNRINPHGPFAAEAGCYTDDTRMSIILCRAAIRACGAPLRGHVAEAIIDYSRNAANALERSFIDEYSLKAIHAGDKEAFGGRPTNGGIMGIAPLGLIYPCDPVRAYEETFRNLFISTGTARSASALAAAMIAGAMKIGADADSAVNDALKAASAYKKKVEGRYWRTSNLYPIASLKAEQLLERAAELGIKYRDPFAFQEELYGLVVQPFFADGSETLAIAAAMFTAAGGDFNGTVTGCVNFGRDNDSSASVGGAAAGALIGASRINREWISAVEAANPAPLPYDDLKDLSDALCSVTARRIKNENKVLKLQAGYFLDEDGSSLLSAAKDGRPDDLLNLLISGVDVDFIDDKGTTALHFAAWENQSDCVRLLLGHGADPEIAEGAGWTALHDAVRREYVDIVCLILSSLRGSGKTEADYKLSGTAGDERFLRMLGLLKDEYVRLDSIGICGKGLLDDATERGYEKSAEYLRGEAVCHEA